MAHVQSRDDYHLKNGLAAFAAIPMMMVPNVQVYPSRGPCARAVARPSGRGVAIDDLCKDIGDQRVE